MRYTLLACMLCTSFTTSLASICFGQGKQDAKWAAIQSAFTSEEEFKLAVVGKTHLKGSVLGSEQVGKTELQTQEIIRQDVDIHKKSIDWGVSGNLNNTYTSGHEPKVGGKGDIHYNRSHARQKLVSSVGGSSEAPIDYLNTQSEVKVDSEMAVLAYDLATDAGKVGKEMVADFKTIGLAGATVLRSTLKVGQTGVMGAMEATQRGIASLGGSMEMTEKEEKTKQLAQAETNEQLEGVMDGSNAQFQKQMGVKDPAKLQLYQGESEEIKQADEKRAKERATQGESEEPKVKQASHANNKGSFYEQENEINYNMSKKGANRVENIVETLAHENTHKAISDTTVSRRFINNDQEEAVANQVGWAAKHASKIVQDKYVSSSKPSLQTTETQRIEWNASNREALRANNEKVASLDPDKVKPLFDMERDPNIWKLLSTPEGRKLWRSFFPIWGSGEKAWEAYLAGNYGKAAVDTTLAVLEALPFVEFFTNSLRVAKSGTQLLEVASQMGSVGSEVGGFNTFSAFKRVYGAAGPGQAWHHIVEQTPGNLAQFGNLAIHNPANLMKLPHGAGSIHAMLSGHYSSKQFYTNGLTVRQWLSTQSYQQQLEYGIQMLNKFDSIAP